MTDSNDFDKLKGDVSQWAKFQSDKMRRRVAVLTLKDKHAVHKAARAKALNPDYKPLQASIGASIKTDTFHNVNRVNFRFPKHGIFLEHGVGRGRPVRSAKARPKPWLKPVLDPALDELADILAKGYADAAGAEINFSIPGILDRKNTVTNGQ